MSTLHPPSESASEAACRHEKAHTALGRGYRRLVSLTREPRVLVNEFDRRVEEDKLTDNKQDSERQHQYVDVLAMLVCFISHPFHFDSQ